MDSSLRLFIAIELPPAVRAALAAARIQLEKNGKIPLRWANPEGAHLTLKFLGDTPAEQAEPIVAALERVMGLHHPFLLHTANLGVFPRPQAPRVVWLGVDGELAKLRALQADVERFVAPLGFPTERRAFSPHLTLGRADKSPRTQEMAAIGSAVAGAMPPARVTWEVSQVALMRSELLREGARYTAVQRLLLDATAEKNSEP
jgi:2'-5' RNA ligase